MPDDKTDSGMRRHSLHALAINLLKRGPQSILNLLEMWQPNNRTELVLVLCDLAAWGEIAYCEHCERVYLLDGAYTSLCGECAVLLAVRVLADDGQVPEVVN